MSQWGAWVCDRIAENCKTKLRWHCIILCTCITCCLCIKNEDGLDHFDSYCRLIFAHISGWWKPEEMYVLEETWEYATKVNAESRDPTRFHFIRVVTHTKHNRHTTVVQRVDVKRRCQHLPSLHFLKFLLFYTAFSPHTQAKRPKTVSRTRVYN